MTTIEIISRETIKPSSPTPSHLQTYQLSFLDQIAPPQYTPFIIFYESKPCINLRNAEKSTQLKASLSETLTNFYPLAGRLVNNEYVNCNDEGVPYIEASSMSKLSEVIYNPNITELDKFLPRARDEFYDNVALAIQVNFFKCGGLAISICISHKLADAFSMFMFVNSWAATLLGHSDVPIKFPRFESAMLFPPRNDVTFPQIHLPIVEDQKEKILVTKVFVFKSKMLEILRTRFSNNEDKECRILATRVEALTAFLCNRHEIATKPNKNYTITHTVNIRRETKPLVSKYHFGNNFGVVRAKASIEEVKGEGRHSFLRKIRDSIKSIAVDGTLQEGDTYWNFMKEIFEQVENGETVDLLFSSWCRMAAYEVDFGWGKPAWVALTSLPFKNSAWFMDSRDGDGIDVWIGLEEEDMAKLEGDEEFLSFCDSYFSPALRE